MGTIYRVGLMDNLGDLTIRHESRPAEQLMPEVREKISSTIMGLQWLPWVVPAETQLSELPGLFETPNPLVWCKSEKGLPNLRYHESAASQAIQFLNTLDASCRIALRRLIVHEDHKSAAMPECHAHGLIEHLQRLPNLRIEYRIGMWNTV
jgi:hypothetical protein